MNYRDYEIEIKQDELAECPRSMFDNFGTMVCFHNRYSLGDYNEFDSPEEFNSFLEEEKDRIVVLPLYLYDHSGISMSYDNGSYPFNCRWDSGMVGYIYAHIGKEGIEDKDHILRLLKSEVETYNNFISGEVYWYSVPEADESCGGFYGSDFENNGLLEYARNAIDCHINQVKEERRIEAIQAIKTARSSRAFSKRKRAVRTA